MVQTTRGLVLRECDYKDSDKILTVLTVDGGLLTLRAPGVKKQGSKLRGGCQILVFSEFTVSENRGFSTVREATPVELFFKVRQDAELLSLAMYFAQLTELLSQEDAPNDELLRLTYSAFLALDRGRPQEIIKAAFELRAAALAGYTPQVGVCPICGNTAPDRLNLTDGTVQCAGCGTAKGSFCLPITAGTLDAMRYILAAETQRIFSFSVSERTAEELCGVTETYLLTRFERGFSALDFYRMMKLT